MAVGILLPFVVLDLVVVVNPEESSEPSPRDTPASKDGSAPESRSSADSGTSLPRNGQAPRQNKLDPNLALSPASFALHEVLFEACSQIEAINIIYAALQYGTQEHGELSDEHAEQLRNLIDGTLSELQKREALDPVEVLLSYPCAPDISLSAYCASAVVTSGRDLLITRQGFRFGANSSSVPLRILCSIGDSENLFEVRLVWEEELARHLKSEPDRWEELGAVTEVLFEAQEDLHLDLEVPRKGISQGSRIELLEGKIWVHLGPEKPSALSNLYDEHLAARPDLLSYYITRSIEERESNRISILKKLFGYCEVASLDLEGRTREELEGLLQEARQVFDAPDSGIELAFIEISDLLIPVGPKTTLDALQADYDLLMRIKAERESEYLRRDSAELLGLRVQAARARHIEKTLSVFGVLESEKISLNIAGFLLRGDELSEEALLVLGAKGSRKIEHGTTLVSNAGQEAQLSRYLEILPKGGGGPILRIYGVPADFPDFSGDDESIVDEGRPTSDEPIDPMEGDEAGSPNFEVEDPTIANAGLIESEVLYPDRMEINIEWHELEEDGPSPTERAGRIKFVDDILSAIRRRDDLPEKLPPLFEDLPVSSKEVEGTLVGDLYTRHLNADVTITLSPRIRGCLA